MNNKGNSKVFLMVGIIFFYSFIFILYGLYGSTIDKYGSPSITSESKTNTPNYYTSINGTSEYISFDVENSNSGSVKSFFGNAISGFKESPTWLNLLIFVPLLIIIIYLITSTYIPLIPG